MSSIAEAPMRVGEQINIKASQIFRNPATGGGLGLRDVDTKSTKFAELKRSIGTPRVRETQQADGTTRREVVCSHGMLNPISVRPLPGEPGKYALVDGGHRHAAWQELFGDALPIPAHVIDLNEVQVMEAQIEGNFHVVKTKRTENVKQIKKLMEMFPLRTVDEQAQRLSMDPATLRQWFGLLHLGGTRFVEENGEQKSVIAVATDDGSLPLGAAFVISTAWDKVDAHQEFWAKKQDELFDAGLAAAKSSAPQAVYKFCMEATHAIKQIKDAFKKDQDPTKITAETTVPVLRKLGELKVELGRQVDAVTENQRDQALKKQVDELSAAYPDALRAVRQDGYLSGLQYALQVDAETIEERKKQKEEQEQARKEKQDERKAGSKAAALSRSAGMFGRRLT